MNIGTYITHIHTPNRYLKRCRIYRNKFQIYPKFYTNTKLLSSSNFKSLHVIAPKRYPTKSRNQTGLGR